MRSSRSAPAALVVALVSASASPAFADATACAAAAELGQLARAAGKLRQARTSFLACAADECPALVRRDCQEWASTTAEAMPSIIVDARDGSEHDVGDVQVTMDGEVLARSVDGSAIPVDPGAHTFVFERAQSAAVTEHVFIKERAKGRTFVLRFGAAGTAQTATTPAVAEHAAADAPPARGHTVAPWILIGVGGAVAVTGVTLYVTAPKLPPNCDETNGSCKSTGPSDDLTADRKQAGASLGLKTAGTIAVAGGLLVLAGGLLWHFLEPTGERRVTQTTTTTTTTMVPWSTGTASGISALGAF